RMSTQIYAWPPDHYRLWVELFRRPGPPARTLTLGNPGWRPRSASAVGLGSDTVYLADCLIVSTVTNPNGAPLGFFVTPDAIVLVVQIPWGDPVVKKDRIRSTFRYVHSYGIYRLESFEQFGTAYLPGFCSKELNVDWRCRCGLNK